MTPSHFPRLEYKSVAIGLLLGLIVGIGLSLIASVVIDDDEVLSFDTPGTFGVRYDGGSDYPAHRRIQEVTSITFQRDFVLVHTHDGKTEAFPRDAIRGMGWSTVAE